MTKYRHFAPYMFIAIAAAVSLLLLSYLPPAQAQSEAWAPKAVSITSTYASHNSTVYYFVLYDDGLIERYFIGPIPQESTPK